MVEEQESVAEGVTKILESRTSSQRDEREVSK